MPDPKFVLKLSMEPNNADAATVKEYLKKLLKMLIVDSDFFNSKRPFGFLGWTHEIYRELADAGLIDAKYNGETLESYDYDAAEKFILDAIDTW
jgi:hypothetical protein